MPETKRCLRVFVGSPGDVAEEREAVSEVIARLNSQLDQVYFEAVRWELHPHPRDTRLTPQTAIAAGIPRPGDCAVAVFIFWSRIGTVLDMKGLEVNGAGDRPTGTTWEFHDALESSGKPRVLTYRKIAPPSYNRLQMDDDELTEVDEQERGLRSFFKSLRGPEREYRQYIHSFTETTEFKADLLEQLQLFARDHQPSPAPPPPHGQDRDLDTIPADYLRYLRERHRHVDLGGLDSSEMLETRLPLIYVPALTPANLVVVIRPPEDDGKAGRELPTRRIDHFRLLHRLGEDSLYVAGHAGQGKSIFCQWLMVVMAEGRVPVMPFEEECDEDYRESLPDSLAGRLPLLLRLSEFHHALALQPGQAELSGHQLEEALYRWLDAQRPGELEPERVRHHLGKGNLLLVLDGVDEVPESEGDAYPRRALLSGLAAAVREWTRRGNRLLLTSRPHALNPTHLARLGLEQAPLAPLPTGLQTLFVKRWFHATDAQALVEEMLAELRDRSDLQELRENPLLLTAICVKYHNQKRLPHDIHDLYQGITEQVLHSRFRSEVTLGGSATPRLSGRGEIVRRLEVIALGMHRGRPEEPRDQPVRDIAYRELEAHLAAYADANPTQEGGAGLVESRREELLSHSGLLLARENRRAGFFHWTFQDYFAAERLYRLGEPLRELLPQRAGQREWHNTLRMLLARTLADKDADLVLAHLQALEPLLEPEPLAANPAPALLLGRLLEIVHARTGGRLGEWTAYFKQVCLDALHKVDDPADRNALFTHLAAIGGDDRPGVGLDERGLPDIDWVEIPVGPFLYGKDQQRVTLDAFAISRYPITHAQFQAFIDAGGYDDDWWWEGLQHKPPQPARWPITNRPRENVSWYDAMAFCRWLSVATGQHITLPNEQQWEKAARGEDGREFPWGDEFRSGYANCNENTAGSHNLQQTSAVGLYPQGKSPYGVADMSGNVSEWCRDFYDHDEFRHILRGGSWYDFPSDLYPTSRDWLTPDNRLNDLGFRVVLPSH